MIELAQQYRETSLRLAMHRSKLKERSKKARGEEFFSLQKRISLLNDEIYELDHISAYLLEYDKKGGNNIIEN